jgi:hypothetical protein
VSVHLDPESTAPRSPSSFAFSARAVLNLVRPARWSDPGRFRGNRSSDPRSAVDQHLSFPPQIDSTSSTSSASDSSFHVSGYWRTRRTEVSLSNRSDRPDRRSNS